MHMRHVGARAPACSTPPFFVFAVGKRHCTRRGTSSTREINEEGTLLRDGKDWSNDKDEEDVEVVKEGRLRDGLSTLFEVYTHDESKSEDNESESDMDMGDGITIDITEEARIVH